MLQTQKCACVQNFAYFAQQFTSFMHKLDSSICSILFIYLFIYFFNAPS